MVFLRQTINWSRVTTTKWREQRFCTRLFQQPCTALHQDHSNNTTFPFYAAKQVNPPNDTIQNLHITSKFQFRPFPLLLDPRLFKQGKVQSSSRKANFLGLTAYPLKLMGKLVLQPCESIISYYYTVSCRCKSSSSGLSSPAPPLYFLPPSPLSDININFKIYSTVQEQRNFGEKASKMTKCPGH